LRVEAGEAGYGRSGKPETASSYSRTAQSALIAGTSTTAQGALFNDSQAATDIVQLSAENLGDNQAAA
jgi:hypothetical protein